MPKNRHAKAPHSHADHAQTAPQSPIGPVRFSIALLALLVAIVATGLLSFDSLEIGGTIFGCGEGEGCDKAASSVFGSIPGLGWPVSFVGFAFFVAMIGALFMHRRGITPLFKAMAALGALGSAFFSVVILLHLDEYTCKYCITSHVANFVFAGAILSAGMTRSAVKPLPSLAGPGVAFALVTIALFGARAWATSHNNAKADEQAAATVDGINRTANQNGTTPNVTGIDDDPTTATTLPAGWLQGFEREVAYDSEHLPQPAYRTDERGFTGHYRLGPKDAPLRIVVFSCYECKFCAVLEKEIFDILETRSDVSFTHKHFPLNDDCNPHATNVRTKHPNGCIASFVAEAAGLLYGPEAFWRLHEYYFRAIRDKAEFNIQDVLRGFGMDPQRVLALAQSSKQVRATVRRDADTASELGLRQTPFVFINGVEVRGLNRVGALTAIIEDAAPNARPGSPENDAPPPAIQKFVDDYFKIRARAVDLGTDVTPNALGPESAPIDVQVWFAFKTPATNPTLRAFRSVQERYPNAVRLSYRHYPMGESCNFFSDTSRYPGSCEMHMALEGAGLVGGNRAFNDALAWLLDNEERFAPENAHVMRRQLAEAIGLDPDTYDEYVSAQAALVGRALNEATLEEKMIHEGIVLDAATLNNMNTRAAIPILFVDGKRVAKYASDGDITSVLDGIVKQKLGLTE